MRTPDREDPSFTRVEDEKSRRLTGELQMRGVWVERRSLTHDIQCTSQLQGKENQLTSLIRPGNSLPLLKLQDLLVQRAKQPIL